jgi:hypothetical protein
MTSIVFARILVRHLSDKFDNIFVFAQPSREFLAVFCLSKHLRFCHPIWLPGKIRKADTERKNDYGDFQAQLSFIGSSLGSKAPHADIL